MERLCKWMLSKQKEETSQPLKDTDCGVRSWGSAIAAWNIIAKTMLPLPHCLEGAKAQPSKHTGLGAISRGLGAEAGKQPASAHLVWAAGLRILGVSWSAVLDTPRQEFGSTSCPWNSGVSGLQGNLSQRTRHISVSEEPPDFTTLESGRRSCRETVSPGALRLKVWASANCKVLSLMYPKGSFLEYDTRCVYVCEVFFEATYCINTGNALGSSTPTGDGHRKTAQHVRSTTQSSQGSPEIKATKLILMLYSLGEAGIAWAVRLGPDSGSVGQRLLSPGSEPAEIVASRPLGELAGERLPKPQQAQDQASKQPLGVDQDPSSTLLGGNLPYLSSQSPCCCSVPANVNGPGIEKQNLPRRVSAPECKASAEKKRASWLGGSETVATEKAQYVVPCSTLRHRASLRSPHWMPIGDPEAHEMGIPSCNGDP
ncbi:hypothetical protein Celaphus_00012816 [Cervus elaphus hippelaphus]|uniref:Uncharacterized protein n=1 Tax=Cervus elaphus hippelaphus TaxID=46360 RepID=A0A212CJE2_CEREH|nr:hypothetical protein Celaphus_00012816 [Cervus elaphus hippelaphus]